MCRNIPVVISKFVGLASYVQKINGGWVVDLNCNELAAIVDSIIANKEFLNYVHIQEIIYRDFNLSNLAQKYITEYQNI